ncbi:LCP family protein [Nocardioides caldifontis]|uniref:LCP family protein n=1 Tax=Nocardioides caldifontis TaxID=2588938 RepID=UPI0011E00A63|nr:LCP family protein [Nocardioides caldifontis]
MADGRKDPRGGDDFDWLYQGGRKGGRGQEPPESDATRVLPTFDRDEPPRRRRDDARRQEGREEPQRIAPTPGAPPKTRRKRRFRARWLLLVPLAWLLFLVGVPVYAWNSVSQVDAEPGGERPADQPGTTYLVVGSDGRAGLAGERTDTIMLLHTGDGPNLLLSIPRDSIVEVPGHGTTKINAAFAFGGPKLMVQTVEGATGIRIDHYVEMGFTGLVQLVDAVGGIEICPESAIDDPMAELKISKGCQEVDGKTALGYARSRKSQQLGDIDRARHQREVVSSIGSEIVSWQTVVNPLRYWRVVNAGAETVTVSEGTGPISAGRFAYAMTRVDGKSGLTCTVPIADLAVNWDQERADQLFSLIAEDRTAEVGKDLCLPTGMRQ